VRLLHKLHLAAAAVGAISAAVALIASVLPGSPQPPEPVGKVLVNLLFVVFGAAVLRLVAAFWAAGVPSGPERARWVREAVPSVVRVIAGVFLFGAFASVGSAVLGPLNGVPYQKDGAYFENDHGRRHQITEAQYRAQVARAVRLEYGGLTGLYTVAFITAWAAGAARTSGSPSLAVRGA
jgi:hypothetical protein